MCIQFACLDCKKTKYKACEHHDPESSKCDLGTEDVPFLEKAYRCGTCETIKAVIQSLQALLVREPWLATEGAAGAPKKESWEMSSERSGEIQPYDSDDDDDEDGYTAEERKAIREEAERAVALRWGLLKKEQEQEEEHKSN